MTNRLEIGDVIKMSYEIPGSLTGFTEPMILYRTGIVIDVIMSGLDRRITVKSTDTEYDVVTTELLEVGDMAENGKTDMYCDLEMCEYCKVQILSR